MRRPWIRHTFLLICAAAVIGAASKAARAVNIIYMIADGAGFPTYEATSYFNGNPGGERVRGPGWIGLAMSTYPLRKDSTAPGGNEQDPNVVYNSASAWNTTPTGHAPLEFQGYQWNDETYPDSANTLSSTMTGVKSYNNAINVDGAGRPLKTFAQLAFEQHGMRTGIVTTVQWPDATPAAFSGINNVSRRNHHEIADQMLGAEYIDVIMGAGNPDYDDDGTLRFTPDFDWIGEATWSDLIDRNAIGHSRLWRLIQDKDDFERLASGALKLEAGRKLLGVVRSFNGKQQYRSADGGLTENYTTHPNLNLKTDVPELTTMVQGTLAILTPSTNGFFLGVEQGEVDRAMHANHLGRMIEAQLEFNSAVEWIDDYLTGNAGNPDLPNYENTLVIVTADHDHQLYGAESDTIPFAPLQDNGPGALPGARFQTKTHSNHLVPIFARGLGANSLAKYADQTDIYTDGIRTFGHGAYLDQTELFEVFAAVADVHSSVAVTPTAPAPPPSLR